MKTIDKVQDGIDRLEKKIESLELRGVDISKVSNRQYARIHSSGVLTGYHLVLKMLKHKRKQL